MPAPYTGRDPLEGASRRHLHTLHALNRPGCRGGARKRLQLPHHTQRRANPHQLPVYSNPSQTLTHVLRSSRMVEESHAQIWPLRRIKLAGHAGLQPSTAQRWPCARVSTFRALLETLLSGFSTQCSGFRLSYGNSGKLPGSMPLTFAKSPCIPERSPQKPLVFCRPKGRKMAQGTDATQAACSSRWTWSPWSFGEDDKQGSQGSLHLKIKL